MDYDVGVFKRRRIIPADETYFSAPVVLPVIRGPYTFVADASAASTGPSTGATTSAINTAGASLFVAAVSYFPSTGSAGVSVSDSINGTSGWIRGTSYDNGSGGGTI